MLKKNEAIRQLSDALVDILHLEFGDDQGVVDLFQQFLDCEVYSRQFASKLIDVGGGKLGHSWEVRRLAALMLQEHLLGLDPADLTEHEFVLRKLGLRLGVKRSFPKSVLKEGYTCRDLHGFVDEFRRKLTKLRSAVRPGRIRDVTGDEIRDFAAQSRQDCKLALARYLFPPDEVVARIHSQVKLRSGVPLAEETGLEQEEAQRVIESLPGYEAAILRKLQTETSVVWVADDTSSRLNALVEYPLGTVVLVVKPPGSHHEFEIKRAGRRGKHPLSARSHVPPSHRLDGGSMVSALQWDAAKTAAFGRLYGLVHGEPAPIANIVNLLGKAGVPVGDEECPIVEFLTDRTIYGEGYDEMRKAMAIVVDCFRDERGNITPPIPGDYGLTAQFIAFAGPAQATICGSSSFRLDLLARYLSLDGPNEYFQSGLQVSYTPRDARRLADDLLDEILAVYDPPDVEYRDHEQYVTAALAVPKNRARANAVYLDLWRQIGIMWGTLLAVRGYSFGESFVSRNVGLRTVWNRGDWRVRLVFLDHDNLVLPDADQTQFWPMTALPPSTMDDGFIGEPHVSEGFKTEFNSLQQIYQVDEPLRDKGVKRYRQALKRAYIKTQKTIQADPQAHSRFNKRFIERLRDWDAVARKYIARNKSPDGESWKSRVQKYLRKRSYSQESIDEHCLALERYGSHVEKYGFLHRAKIDDA